MLDDLIAGKISFSEAENKSKQYKSLSMVKDAFMKEVQLKSWDEAAKVIEAIGGQERLSSFNIKQGKPLPKNFEVYITCMYRYLLLIHQYSTLFHAPVWPDVITY